MATSGNFGLELNDHVCAVLNLDYLCKYIATLYMKTVYRNQGGSVM